MVDIREGAALERFPALFKRIRRQVPTRLIFLEADESALIRRFSETRRPHPLGVGQSVADSVQRERAQLEPIRRLADDVYRLVAVLAVDAESQGRGHVVRGQEEHDLLDRFLPNPNYIPSFKKLSGKNPSVARYIRSFPQTQEFIERISNLLVYLLPHYIQEGKSYLTIAFGCTGGRHRSVMIGHEIAKRLAAAGYRVKETHRDVGRS